MLRANARPPASVAAASPSPGEGGCAGSGRQRRWPTRGDQVRDLLVLRIVSPLALSVRLRLFVQQNVPQLKFFNPSVMFSVESADSRRSEIVFVSGMTSPPVVRHVTINNSDDGERKVVETTGLQWKDIQSQLNSLFTPPTELEQS